MFHQKFVIIWKVVGQADFYWSSVTCICYQSHKKSELIADSIARYFLFLDGVVWEGGEVLGSGILEMVKSLW
jgi:hypothetical protein